MTEIASWQQLLGQPDQRHHIAHLYRNEEQLTATVSHFTAEGLRRGEAVILVVTPEHWASFVARLETYPDIELVAAVLRGQLRILDARLTLSACMTDGQPAWERFQNAVGKEIVRAGRRCPRTRIYGEMVDLLWQQGSRSEATRLEELWNEFGRRQPFSLLCAYQVDQQDADACDATRQCACKTHSHLVHDLGREPDANNASLYVESISDTTSETISEAT